MEPNSCNFVKEFYVKLASYIVPSNLLFLSRHEFGTLLFGLGVILLFLKRRQFIRLANLYLSSNKMLNDAAFKPSA